jgi:hypothetical protein
MGKVVRFNTRQVTDWLVSTWKYVVLFLKLIGVFVYLQAQMLLDHRQKDFGDQPTNAEILEALGLDSSQANQ